MGGQHRTDSSSRPHPRTTSNTGRIKAPHHAAAGAGAGAGASTAAGVALGGPLTGVTTVPRIK